MNDLFNAIWIELRKAMRSKVPVLSAAGFMLLPLACAFLMFVYKDPEFARRAGLISAKANLAGGSADWPFYLGMFAQGIAVGGILLFSLVTSWVFGREFADGTLKDLLAVPVGRGTLLAAKFVITALWAALLTALVYLTGLLLGALVGLPLGSPELFLRGTLRVAFIAVLVLLAVTPVAFFASVGRGYLLPMGLALLLLALGNVIAVLGWGAYFPWSVPALAAGLTGEGAGLGAASYAVVALTGAAGVGATRLWWLRADQSR